MVRTRASGRSAPKAETPGEKAEAKEVISLDSDPESNVELAEDAAQGSGSDSEPADGGDDVAADAADEDGSDEAADAADEEGSDEAAADAEAAASDDDSDDSDDDAPEEVGAAAAQAVAAESAKDRAAARRAAAAAEKKKGAEHAAALEARAAANKEAHAAAEEQKRKAAKKAAAAADEALPDELPADLIAKAMERKRAAEKEAKAAAAAEASAGKKREAKKRRREQPTAKEAGPVTVRVLAAESEAYKASESALAFAAKRITGRKRSACMLAPTKKAGGSLDYGHRGPAREFVKQP